MAIMNVDAQVQAGLKAIEEYAAREVASIERLRDAAKREVQDAGRALAAGVMPALAMFGVDAVAMIREVEVCASDRRSAGEPIHLRGVSAEVCPNGYLKAGEHGENPFLLMDRSVRSDGPVVRPGRYRAVFVMLPIAAACRGCGKPLDPANVRVADGCPCSGPRGLNHGLVVRETCTCVECDPAQTGSTRYGPSKS